jgi:sigma-B regulation protein RsbU (phosphoserine phosphatase)
VVNEELCKNNPHSSFVTLFFGLLDIATGELIFCNAGHISPILAIGGEVQEIRTEPEPALGVLEGMAFSDHRLTMRIGEMLVLSSDGLSDMLDPQSQAFGGARVLSEIAAFPDAPAVDLIGHLLSAARAFAGGVAQFDDITMLAVRRLA